MNTDLDLFLDSLYKSSCALSGKILDFYDKLGLHESTTSAHRSVINKIQSLLKLADETIEIHKSSLDLFRSRSHDPDYQSFNSSLSEMSKFWVLGQFLQDPLIKNKYLEAGNDLMLLDHFLSCYNSLKPSQASSFQEVYENLDSFIKLYLEKSKKHVINKINYYDLNQFCCKTSLWLSNIQENQGFNIKNNAETEDINTYNFNFINTPLSNPSPSFEICPEPKITIEKNKLFKNPSNYAGNKVYPSCEDAIFDIQTGNTLLIGGFSTVGSPETLLKAIHSKNLKNLNLSCCLTGTNESGIGLLVKKKMVKSVLTSHIGTNTELERQYLNGEIELEFVTQGSLVEKYRASSAGIHSFYTPSGLGTFVEHGQVPIKYSLGGKDVEKYTTPRDFIVQNGKKYFLEKAVTGDFGIIKAWKADTMGNLVYRRTARNSNPDIAGACKITIAEVEEIVPAGALDPDQIHTPGILVQRIVKCNPSDKIIERLSLKKDGEIQIPGTLDSIKKRERIARRAAKEIKNGMYVNLGLGMPTLIPNYLPSDISIVLHGENGLLGIGSYPNEGYQDPDIVNASRETITLSTGASTLSSSTSFGIVRGGHLDLTILGGLQVSEQGDLANWIVPDHKVKGMGGAMDLVNTSSRCIVCMEHLNFGSCKLIPKCSMPLTGKQVVHMLITDLGVFEFNSTGMTLTEISEDITLNYLKANTPANFSVHPYLKIMQQ